MTVTIPIAASPQGTPWVSPREQAGGSLVWPVRGLSEVVHANDAAATPAQADVDARGGRAHEECTPPTCAAGSRADLVAPVHLELDATDVSRMAGHANYRITLDMYAGILDRARQANR